MADRNLIKLIPVSLLFGSMTLTGLLSPTSAYSDSERRPLATLPTLTIEKFISGNYATDFEAYSLDQFPLRDAFRSLKTATSLYLLGQKQVNDLYLHDGYIVKSTMSTHDSMISNAANHFNRIYEMYMADNDVNVYLSIIPDKNYFLAKDAGQLSMDYDALVSQLTEAVPAMKYVDIFPSLDIQDYYYTDTHWKQEALIPTANTLLAAMEPHSTDSSLSIDNYTVQSVSTPFYGVYYGQLGLTIAPDTLSYLTNPTLDECVVTDYDTGSPTPSYLYDLSEVSGKDPYELFVCGSSALVTIENPNAISDRELILFRDSFGSSIAPLLVDKYAKITLVDTRYIHSGMLGNFITFNNQDVLFLYSTLVLNSSASFK